MLISKTTALLKDLKLWAILYAFGSKLLARIINETILILLFFKVTKFENLSSPMPFQLLAFLYLQVESIDDHIFHLLETNLVLQVLKILLQIQNQNNNQRPLTKE